MKKRKAVKKTARTQAKKRTVARTKRAASSPAKKRKAGGSKKARTKSTNAKSVRAKTSRKKAATSTTSRRAGRRPADPREFSRGDAASNRAGQSGDIQELSNRAGADSESVEELVDEGNAFEAEAIEGVERAGNSTREVRTRQVPEDDVPGEYLDED